MPLKPVTVWTAAPTLSVMVRRQFRNIRALATFVALALALPAAARSQDIGIAIGKKAPAAVVQTLDGKAVNLSSYIGKTPVLIEFWATWCSKCKDLEPSMLAAQKKYGGRVRFVGVAVSVNQSPARIKAYAKKHNLTIDVLYDADGKATDAYEVPATSYIIVINRRGEIVYTGLGGSQDLEAAVKKAL
ncbi:MAG TPA: TlpA disulfide reductase family protein [Gemmatimonadaceae bacterium]|nr:TlpA disulfide reductase family protein [Gemmatimonadaceae bacterium]